MRMIFKTNLFFIFWDGPHGGPWRKNNFKLLFIFWIMVWNENENDFYFLDGPHDGKKTISSYFLFFGS